MDKLNLHAHAPRDVARLVEEQVLKWSLSERQRPRTQPYWPVVTISREYGSQGAELGKRVARRMGFVYWDRAIVTDLAETLRAGEGAIENLDEHARTAIDDLLGTVLFQETIMSMDYTDELRRLLLEIQRGGSAVIVGRGAHCFLNPESSLRVRVVSPFSRRVAGLRARKGLSEEAAIREIRAADADRAEFVRRTFGADVSDPTRYDIIVNTHWLQPDTSEAIVLDAYGAKFGRLPTTTTDELHRGCEDFSADGRT